MTVTPNFANRTVWTGDNLDILRGMNSATVDLIYLDPPFNSNRTNEAPVGSLAAGAAFKDSWSLSDLDVAWMGLIADEHPSIAYALDAAGRTYGKGMQSYLTMMAVRLLELRRVLKPSGSIYLHRDPCASHFLKMLVDAVFGRGNFRNEISWRRTIGRSDAKRWGRVHDCILYYARDGAAWNSVYREHDPAYVKRMYRYRDARGVYRPHDLTAKGLTGGYTYEFHGHHGPWRFPEHRMAELEADARIHLPKKAGGVPCIKRYLKDSKGRMVNDFFDDIPPASKERVGYPTQKPRALLERIIQASSNPGDVVLDPLCGCATACVAAERLDRQWVGTDLSPKAAELVLHRLDGPEYGAIFRRTWVTHLTDFPRRTDIDAPRNYWKLKQVLSGQQEGVCAGCAMHFPFKVFEINHVVPQSRGGANHLDNLQLLCAHCNRVKGDRDQAYLRAHVEAVAT